MSGGKAKLDSCLQTKVACVHSDWISDNTSYVMVNGKAYLLLSNHSDTINVKPSQTTQQ